jgi:hypothetical protein
MILEDPPGSEMDAFELLQEFVVDGPVKKEDAEKLCRQLFADLKGSGMLAGVERFQLKAERLPEPVVMGDLVLLENDELFDFRKGMGGNSNSEMQAYSKK